ncbi:TonB-dependent receptor [Nibribacter ruber]|uniref:TonB-dependent receptor n=1 Tax=Nibribacter ruber TaxID=2698458 RepID=A0A6P1NVJ2_9BACT|nr:outer membrane beta-barrel family protein [Nibribacter ruber]QHL85998.1 TonB-dependent receptor [Nibribacter ruber]
MKKRARILLGLLCFCLFFLGQAQAQGTSQAPIASAQSSPGKISGTLTDSLTQAPLEFVTVALLKKGTTQSMGGTITDAKGQYAFNGLPAGDYSLTFSFIGFQTKTVSTVSITAEKPDVRVGNVRLASSSKQLKEVKVEALRPTITQEADKIVVSIEGTALAAGRTAYDVLAKSPGVFVDQDGNIQLNGRGGVTVMMDGKLTYLSPSDLRTVLEGMSAENIKNIEIIANPTSKFDAEGTAGILNINLKKNEIQGLNGSVYGTYNTNFKQHGYSTGGNINFKTGKWNSFASIDQMQRIGNREGTFERVYDAEGGKIYFDQTANGKHKNQGPPTFRIGTDYSINDKHSVGALTSFNQNTVWVDFITDSYMGLDRQNPETFINANNFLTNRFRSSTNNVHYQGKLDTVGTTLSADFDFVKISNAGSSNFYNYYTDLTEASRPTVQDFLFADTDNGFDIYSGKIDFVKPLNKISKFELGAKASRVVSDNDSRFYFNNNGLVLDPNRTNHFIYDENIYAGYVTYSTKFGDRFQVQAGLRGEKNESTGESPTMNQVNKRSYFNLFPTLFVQQKVSENYQIGYNYSRRIQRPNYGNLNPFISYRDPYTYTTGNPQLRPQYTHAVGITQTFRKDYILTLNYQYVKDVMSELPYLDVENATTIYTTGNVDDLQNVSMTAITPIKIMKNWDTNNTLTLSYNEYTFLTNTDGQLNSDNNNQRVVNSQFLYMLQSSHNILLPMGIQLEVNAAGRGPGVSGLYKVGAMWWVHAGLKKSFLDKKLDLSVNVNDIFRSYRLRFDTTIGQNINNFDQYLYQRTLGVTLRYKFSKGQKVEQRKTNSLDELNRT